MTEEKEYDLKKSAEGIGQLYPILESKEGEIIDGFHREGADKNWKRVRLEHIDTEEKLLVARLVANFHRRIVPYMEKKEWINGLAKIYKKQGLRISGERVGSAGEPPNEIRDKIAQVTGLHSRTVNQYLLEEFKQKAPTHTRKPTIPASERIAHDLGEDYVERHREEVKQELLQDEGFQREATEKFVEATQKKSEASSQALQKAGIPPVPEQIETFVEKAVEVLKQHPPTEKLWSPREKRDFILAFLSRQKISCPICGETKLAWKCGHKFE